MAELKSCPFCDCQLIKKHIHYISIERTAVDFDIWEHPNNGCVLSDRVWRASEIVKVETNFYDKEETYPDCTVQVLTNTATGETSVGWWKNGND